MAARGDGRGWNRYVDAMSRNVWVQLGILCAIAGVLLAIYSGRRAPESPPPPASAGVAPPAAAPPRAPSALAPAPVAAAAIPAAFLGEWNARLEHCGTSLNDSRLRVEPRQIWFFESHAVVGAVTVHDPRDVTVAGRFSGEGDTWQGRVRMVLSPAGDALTLGESTRRRCP